MSISLIAVASVAKALEELNEQMVFVGGAVVGLYADGETVEEVRPTEDIDLTINVVSLSDWRQLDKRLYELGISPDPDGHAICSYKYGSIPLDIMSIEDGLRGPSNRWYAIGLEDLWKVEIEDVSIQILSAPCYLATKFEAYNDRGSDYRTSHDFEDIIFVLSNRETIVNEVKIAHESICQFLQEELKNIVDSGYSEEILTVHLARQDTEALYEDLIEKVTAIINL